MSGYGLDVDHISAHHSAHVSIHTPVISGGTLAACVVAAGTISGCAITGATLSGCAMSGGSIVSSGGSYTSPEIMTPSVTGGTFVNVSSLSFVATQGTFTVLGVGNSSGGDVVMEIPYYYFATPPAAFLMFNGFVGYGRGTVLSFSALPIGIRPAVACHFPVYVSNDNAEAAGDFYVRSDGTATLAATIAGGNFTDQTELYISPVQVMIAITPFA